MLEMIPKILSGRHWSLRLSLCRRYCYLSGDSLWLKLSYRGRKQIYAMAYGPYLLNDDIWLSQNEYLYRFSKNQL